MSAGFRVYATMPQDMPLSRVAAHAQRVEAMGYDGLDRALSAGGGGGAARPGLAQASRAHFAGITRGLAAVAHPIAALYRDGSAV